MLYLSLSLPLHRHLHWYMLYVAFHFLQRNIWKKIVSLFASFPVMEAGNG